MCCILFYNQSYVASVVLLFLQLVSNNLQRVPYQEFPAALRAQPEQNHNPVPVYTHSSSRPPSIQLGKSIVLASVGQSFSTQINVTLILC